MAQFIFIGMVMLLSSQFIPDADVLSSSEPKSSVAHNINEIFPELDAGDTLFPAGSRRMAKPIQKTQSYRLYGIANLVHLLTQAHARGHNSIRFIYTTDNKLYFAHEGNPSVLHNVPAHYMMTGDYCRSAICRSAGNIKFIKTQSGFILTFINHKSGDFRPSFVSLIPVLGILERISSSKSSSSPTENNLVTLAASLTLEKLNGSGGVEHTYKLSSDLLAGMSRLVTNEVLSDNLTSTGKIVTLEAQVELSRRRRMAEADSPTRFNTMGDLGIDDEEDDLPSSYTRRGRALRRQLIDPSSPLNTSNVGGGAASIGFSPTRATSTEGFSVTEPKRLKLGPEKQYDVSDKLGDIEELDDGLEGDFQNGQAQEDESMPSVAKSLFSGGTSF